MSGTWNRLSFDARTTELYVLSFSCSFHLRNNGFRKDVHHDRTARESRLDSVDVELSYGIDRRKFGSSLCKINELKRCSIVDRANSLFQLLRADRQNGYEVQSELEMLLEAQRRDTQRREFLNNKANKFVRLFPSSKKNRFFSMKVRRSEKLQKTGVVRLEQQRHVWKQFLRFVYKFRRNLQQLYL